MKILHFKEVEAATVSITCGNKSGTAFFIRTPAAEQLLLTSDHNLTHAENNSIIVCFREEEVEVEIIQRIPEKDIALLKTKSTPVAVGVLSLLDYKIPYYERWETFGFPAQRISSGGRFDGNVSRLNEGTVWDVDLECDQYKNLNDFSGLSGAPLIMDGWVVGVIGYDLAGTLGASSVHSVVEELKNLHVTISTKDQPPIPYSIEDDISASEPNDAVFQHINDVVHNMASGYYLVSGNPGSGKTTIAAQLQFLNEEYVICDRYFVKVPEDETIPTQLRATPEYFIRWIEEVFFRMLYNSSPPKSERQLNERIAGIHQELSRLSNYYQQQNKIGFLLVDGLDDVSTARMDDFLAVLPMSPMPNLKIIFFCTSKSLLPNDFQLAIDSSCEIQVTPLSIQNAEQYLLKHLADKQLTPTQILDLAQRSEGHPLYLRYLAKFVLSIEDLSTITAWISSIPVIGGEIENYYNKIWLQLKKSPNQIWLAATLSRLRIPIDKKLLYEILPNDVKHDFIVSFDNIQHLLKVDEKVSVYHSSFSQFVNNKTELLSENIHDKIAAYCLEYPGDNFSISERIFHLLNVSVDNRIQATNHCNQEWVDQCALSSIKPDIVLSDIRKTIGLAADLGVSHKVISLLLLSQRVNFRYNTLFDENTTFLVNALLALGKANEALRYVVRNKAVMVSDRDALYLLQRFYEYGANQEAENLQGAINALCKNILSQELNSESFTRYLDLKFSAVALSANSDFENAYHEMDHVRKVAFKMLRKSGNSEDVIFKFKDDVGSYELGYYIWRFGVPPISKTTEAAGVQKFDERSSGFIALSIFQALEFQQKSPSARKIEVLSSWVEDLEYVIDKYGTNSRYHFYILCVLIGRSNRVDIIERLYREEYPQKLDWSFRKENGVDLDHHAIFRFQAYAEAQGFLSQSYSFPALEPIISSDWEKTFGSHFYHLHFLSGKIKRLIADNRGDEVTGLQGELVKLIASLNFTLRNRITWKRSYALPEVFLPIVYQDLADLMLNYFPDHIPVFAQPIIDKTNYQLGLYNEGYIDTLLAIIRKLSKRSIHGKLTFSLTVTLETHVIATVQNRWERNEYLLRIVEVFALLDSKEKANATFKEVIATSMGPSWYKEAQLGIINTVVSSIYRSESDLIYLQKFAAQLEHASGEMTFQRYVKQQQEDFVGDLAKVGLIKKSIAYFKHLVLPEYKVVIRNATSSNADMPYEGEGYILGARAIEEQSGVLHLLLDINCEQSLAAWSLIELLMPGDDRYMDRFAYVQAKILNEAELNIPTNRDELMGRLKRFMVAEMDDQYRYEYLQQLSDRLSDGNFEHLVAVLKPLGIEPKQKIKEEVKGKSESTKGDPLDKLVRAKEQAESKLAIDNKSGARKVIIDALREAQKEKYGIWHPNYSHKIDSLRDLLPEAYTGSADLVKELKDLIINEPYFEEWVIADKLLQLLTNVADGSERRQILSAVSEHIELMVRTPHNLVNDYEWLSRSLDESQDQEDVLLDLLIWFLNHPSLIMKNRTIELLTWLVSKIPEKTVPAITRELLTPGHQISKELAASVLHQAASKDDGAFWPSFERCLMNNEEQLTSINHFMIRMSIIETLEELHRSGIGECKLWIDKFEKNWSQHISRNNDVILEDSVLFDLVSDDLSSLNELGILDKKFCEKFIDQVKNNPSYSIRDLLSATRYIERSFNNFNDISTVTEHEVALRYALNSTITANVSTEVSRDVASILRFYQPTFPENHLTFTNHAAPSNMGDYFKSIFESDEIAPSIFQNIQNELPLAYYRQQYSEDREKSDDVVQVFSFLIPKNSSGVRYIYFQPAFAPNNVAKYEVEYSPRNAVPLFAQCNNGHSIPGCDLVPAIPIKESFEKCHLDRRAINTIHWRHGRNWQQYRQGQPLNCGYCVTIPNSALEALKANYKLVWVIYSGFNIKRIDVFDQSEII